MYFICKKQQYQFQMFYFQYNSCVGTSNSIPSDVIHWLWRWFIFFFTIYIKIFATYILLSLVSIGCGSGSCSYSLSISRSDSSLSESKHSSFMVSLREYEGRCFASAARTWRLLQVVCRWIHLKNRLSCYAVCGPCGSAVWYMLATMSQPMLSCTFPALGSPT